jgi:ComF family protein
MLRVAMDEDFDCIVAVPLHPLRRIWRGYNQSEIYVIEIAKKTKKPNLSRFLRRKRFTSSQGNFGKQGRLKNIEGAFSTEASFKNKRVLLVDDICTTSSTLEECARALKKAGAIKVHAVTIAMT